jgi:hypothetical protein
MESESEVQTETSTRTQRFAEWLMTREERRQEKESNLEGLIKMNLIVSFLTLGMVGGFESVRLAVSLIPYL